MVSRRTLLCRKIRRESAEAAGRVSDVTVDCTVVLVGAAIVQRPSKLLSQFPKVLSLNGLEQPGSVLFATNHFL